MGQKIINLRSHKYYEVLGTTQLTLGLFFCFFITYNLGHLNIDIELFSTARVTVQPWHDSSFLGPLSLWANPPILKPLLVIDAWLVSVSILGQNQR